MVDPLKPTPSEEEKRRFHLLPLEKQAEMVLRHRGKERIRLLVLSDHPKELVERLPELEIFLTVKEVGEKDSLELVSLTSPEQFQYLLDLDLWEKDQLDPKKVLHWMEILLECGEQKVAQVIRSTDPEWIALCLKKFLHVRKWEGESLEVMDRTLFFTLDREYFIAFKKPESRILFEPFLEILYRLDRDLYARLMESQIWELESDLEETSYRFRNARLADYGFPAFEEALEIYQFVNPDALRVEREPKPRARPEGLGGREGSFYLAFQEEGPFFASVLSKMEDPSDRNRLRAEMATLCNKAMIAEPIDLSSLEAMGAVVKKVFHYLNLGLEYLSGRDESKAAGILQSLTLQRLFQCGVGATLLLKRKAETLLKGWFEGDRENLIFLDPPLLERFGGLLRKRPTLHQAGISGDFKDLQDFRETERFLEMIEAVVHAVKKRLNITPRSLKLLDLTGCVPGGWRAISLSALFLTSLAHQVLEGSFRFEAIEKGRLPELFSRVFERDERGRGVVKREIREGLREWLQATEEEEEKRFHLLAFWDFCLALLEEGYGRIPPGEEIDLRFVKGLLIRTGVV